MNILVIRMHRFGDILQLTPMLQGLKKTYPSSRITFFTSNEMSDLLSDNPHVDDVICIPEKKYRYYLKNKPEYYARIYNEMYELITDLKRRKFQIIINRHYEFGGILAHCIGAEQIFGPVFSPESGSFLRDSVSTQLSNVILDNRKTNRRNLVDWSSRIAGLPPGSGKMYFPVTQIDLWAAECLLSKYLAANDRPVAVQMGAAKSFRQWGIDNYGQVIKWLIESKGKKVILLGAEDEKGDAEKLRSRVGKMNRGVIDLVGKTDFKTLGGILKKCETLITGDTGTMHMASAVGTPVIALFYGTAFPWETGPYGTGHLVLYADMKCAPCSYPEDCVFGQTCRIAITPEHVCRTFDISEAIRANRTAAVNYPWEAVKLYLTYRKPGADQTLIPINEILTRNDIRLFCRDAEGEGIVSMSTDDFLLTGNHCLLQKFYRGDIGGFIDFLPGYIDQWMRIVSYINATGMDEHIFAPLIRCLYPAITEAMRALQAKDYTTLSDLLQGDFQHAEDLCATLPAGMSSRRAYADKRGTVQ